jgi:hypothetical protein
MCDLSSSKLDSRKRFWGFPQVHAGICEGNSLHSPRAGCPAVTRRGIFHRELMNFPRIGFKQATKSLFKEYDTRLMMVFWP